MSIATAEAPPEPGAHVIMSRLLNAEDVATIIGVKPETVQKWGRNGWLPPSVRAGKVVRWTAEDVRKFIRDGGPAAS